MFFRDLGTRKGNEYYAVRFVVLEIQKGKDFDFDPIQLSININGVTIYGEQKEKIA